ncbi:zinc metalloprotease [Plantactinospora sonchi]|uniref:Peptidase M50 n=1 Tax=Plantactinospora sonchi TaxID=1544735 RepID=A0ABU7S1Z4_9ACTN
MISRHRRLVAASLLLVSEAVVFGLLVTESVTGAIAAVGITCVSLWVHIVLHECGHLVVAKLLRLPVVAVRIAPFSGWRNEVSVRPAPSTTALPSRMVLFYLGGPLANLCTATVLGAATALTSNPMARLALLGTAILAALLGLASFIPGISPRSDGRSLLRWLVAPTATRAALQAAYYREEVSRTVWAIVREELEDDPLGHLVRAGDDPRLALAAVLRRWSTEHVYSAADLVADAERLAALARAEGTDPSAAAAIGQVLSVQFGMWYLYVAVVDGSPVEHREVVEISELAQLAFDVQPHVLSARVAMSLAHLLNQRPDEARSLLLDIRPGVDPPELCGVAFLLRAIAEWHVGNRADVETLVRAAGGDYQQLTQVVAMIRAADPVPPLFAPAPTADI